MPKCWFIVKCFPLARPVTYYTVEDQARVPLLPIVAISTSSHLAGGTRKGLSFSPWFYHITSAQLVTERLWIIESSCQQNSFSQFHSSCNTPVPYTYIISTRLFHADSSSQREPGCIFDGWYYVEEGLWSLLVLIPPILASINLGIIGLVDLLSSLPSGMSLSAT